MSTIAIGKDVQQAYEQIVNGDKSITWAVFNYEGQSELRLQESGADDLSEFPDEFSDGKLQYAFLRIPEPNSKLPKFVLVGWCGDGAPRKGVFQQHFSSVAAKLTGYHVQITARSEEDVSEASILKKVEDASGAKYSTASPSSVFGPTTSKKPTTNSLVSQLKGQSSPSFSTRKPTQTEPRLPPSASIKPVVSRGPSYANKSTEDWDVPKTNAHGKINKSPPASEVSESRPEPVKSSYQPIGRPDINALRAQAPSENPSLSSQGADNSYKPVEVPKTGSLADRMSAFTQGSSGSPQSSPSAPRKTSNPLASRFGSAVGGTKPAIPSSGPRESRAIGGLGKNFGSEDGKTPAQLWAERKARERGESIPEPVKEAPVKATRYDEPEETSQSQSGIASIKDRFAATSIEDEPFVPKPVSLPPPPSMPARAETPEPEPEEEEEEQEPVTSHDTSASRLPPPPNMSSRPGVVPPAPLLQQEPEDEEPEPVHERDASPEPAPVQNSFKAQLEKTIGGGGAAPAAAHNDPEETAATNAPTARAIYEYEAQEDNELTLQEGELVTDIEMIDEGWWSGKNSSGASGLFPSNYVELIEESESHATPAAVGASSASAPESSGAGLCATALYEYEAAEEGEVGFAEGETISEIQQIDEGWWQGKNARGEEGLFPSNYVELIQ